MKFQNNWRQKCIENLEKNNWGEVSQDESSIVQRLYRLRKVPLDEFAIDDIRFMIIQEQGLPYLLTLAIEILEKDLLAEGNYYEGDVLGAIMKIKPDKWRGCKELWTKIDNLVKPRIEELRQHTPKLEIKNFYLAIFV